MLRKPSQLVVLMALLCPTVLAAGDSKQEETRNKHGKAYAELGNATAVEDFKNTLPRDGKFYVVEGDIRLVEEEIKPYLHQNKVINAAFSASGAELKVNVGPTGEPDIWPKSKRHLKYAVAKSSFQNESQYQTVVRNTEAAAREWESICNECNLRLEHVSASDQAPSLEEETFIVRMHDSGGSYIAAAFFPSTEKGERYLDIDPSYFATSFDQIGVLGHEIGHIIGYRHEHIEGIPGCYREDKNWKPLTEYDPHSRMHYFCGGGGTMTLALTELDKKGHIKAYAK